MHIDAITIRMVCLLYLLFDQRVQMRGSRHCVGGAGGGHEGDREPPLQTAQQARDDALRRMVAEFHLGM